MLNSLYTNTPTYENYMFNTCFYKNVLIIKEKTLLTPLNMWSTKLLLSIINYLRCSQLNCRSCGTWYGQSCSLLILTVNSYVLPYSSWYQDLGTGCLRRQHRGLQFPKFVSRAVCLDSVVQHRCQWSVRNSG